LHLIYYLNIKMVLSPQNYYRRQSKYTLQNPGFRLLPESHYRSDSIRNLRSLYFLRHILDF
jgi:hypothetical protein